MTVRTLLLFSISGICLLGESANSASDSIVENYCAASRGQAQASKAASMQMEIEASIPKLKKQGRLHALRRISALGRITYEALRFEGDNTVKSWVINKYLTAEAESQKDQSPSLAVTPENYKFKYKGRGELNGRDVHIFQVTPRKKRQGLFKGDIWIDAQTYLRLQEAGYMVKNPSIFLKRVQFVRTYEIRDGVSVPRQVQSVVETRLVGKAQLTIDYSDYSMEGGEKRGAMAEAGSQ